MVNGHLGWAIKSRVYDRFTGPHRGITLHLLILPLDGKSPTYEKVAETRHLLEYPGPPSQDYPRGNNADHPTPTSAASVSSHDSPECHKQAVSTS